MLYYSKTVITAYTHFSFIIQGTVNRMTQAEMILGEYQFIVNGNEYFVKPLSFRYILSGEFARDNLVIPLKEENTFEYQSFNITDKRKRKALDKWLKRLVTNSDGKEITFGDVLSDEWTVEDIGNLLKLLIEISGLSPKENTADTLQEQEESSDSGWLYLFGVLMAYGSMSKNEILNSSLPFLYGVSKEIKENQLSCSGMGGLGLMGGSTVSSEQPTTREDFLSMFN